MDRVMGGMWASLRGFVALCLDACVMEGRGARR
jgi:hypothetical protein